ncbi:MULTISPECIES: hypothetical protein [Rhodococcus]|uniref:Uncharacterized protein n=1 Tax=Rhodococcus oxybenzonivorans TaxID=1990687 RepID=A0AAE4V0I3_9NOCA|nr:MULTISPECIES: hypothetical protein [Rhodococcus]MDV7242290.1 hypothetical protein [Rhodococcus oxybenzonivorans]MDV7266535.1 hypothetical protein [Rhodococcus oxybenzonivorans]MDV7276215.1 hypothetical protein [Rhodococcus oxybenzonivorans]MDV7331778.1 hypothetical protein [Rhodococcus oxybenzonivorans]MDV7344000.1 hypothetical protein [Rhodococcus oxybenzonivorans]
MTTQDQQPEGIGSTRGVESSTETAGSGETVSSTETAGSGETVSSTGATGSSTVGTSPSAEGTHSSTEATESSSRQSLFDEDELSVLRSRWDEVQAGFVDDPRECVQKADGLVSDVVDRLTTGFSEARSRLDEQWARGEEGSTEDLRIALKRYREFFQRLLAL